MAAASSWVVAVQVCYPPQLIEMLRLVAPLLSRLDSAYRDQPFFVGLKARLLGAITLLVLIFVPFNIAKTLWVMPPALLPRIGVNLIIGFSALIFLRSLFRGNLERAGNG
ncbi:MAG TPA: hypothetical protein VHO24_05040, partial [Opitutaceae bacterium]|nr:hypothetical protein [Opitutaceae bacterium]